MTVYLSYLDYTSAKKHFNNFLNNWKQPSMMHADSFAKKALNSDNLCAASFKLTLELPYVWPVFVSLLKKEVKPVATSCQIPLAVRMLCHRKHESHFFRSCL